MKIKTAITTLALFLVASSYSLASLACKDFEPKGKLIRGMTSEWFTDSVGKLRNLAVVFRSYDEDGDGFVDFETGTRVFRDKGEEKFPFLYLYGKEMPTAGPDAKPGDAPTYVFVPEKEYIDSEATGFCENIVLTVSKSL